MKKEHSIAILYFLFLGGAVVCAYYPHLASDENPFLRDFVDGDYISFLGIILSITLASLAQLYLTLNNSIRSKVGEDVFLELATELRNTAAFLIGIFAAGLIIVVIKPLISFGIYWEAAINLTCIWLLFFYLLILVDVTFSILDL